jgi:hypothetical protein
MKYSKAEQIILVIVVCSLCIAGHLLWGHRIGKDEATTEASYFPPAELATIRTAAIRNGIQPGTENWYILLAIRKAENGKKFREFGIIHPKCEAEMGKRPDETLDIQAGWAAASILGARERWDGKGDFVDAMGARYCPPEDHPLNKHWAGNVRYWIDRFTESK